MPAQNLLYWLSMSARTAYLLDSFSRDSDSGCQVVLCCRDRQGYFEQVVPQDSLYFFVASRAVLPENPAMQRNTSSLRSLYSDQQLDELRFFKIRDFFQTRQELSNHGIELYESDVHPDDRFLMDRNIYRVMRFEGPELEAVRDPDIDPGFRVLSLDIETGRDGSIYSLAIDARDSQAGFQAVMMRDASGELQKGSLTCPEPPDDKNILNVQLYPVRDEKQLLKDFFRLLEKIDPDIIIGWNVILFDLQFIQERCRLYKVPFALGRRSRVARIIARQSGMAAVEAPGRIVLDGPQSLRGGFHQFTDYRLNTVSRELLGTGKEIEAEGSAKVAEIEERFASDKTALARYNILDAVLVSLVFKKTGLIEQLTTRSCLTGLRMDRTNMSVAAFDFFMLPKIHNQGYAAIDTSRVSSGEHAAGGHVFTSDAGLYDNVAVFDFLSLYPSIIRSFHIDPLSLHLAAEDALQTAAGIPFSRHRHVLPDHIGFLMHSRQEAKKAGNGQLSQAIKILMNSYYGVMGTTGCRFYHPSLPTAITSTGQWLLKRCADYMRSAGYKVLYGDTDSVFVQVPGKECQALEELARSATVHIGQLIKEHFGAESFLQLEFEKLYLRFFLPPMRGSNAGSRKRYAGLDQASGEIEFKGLEAVRSDWTPAARLFQQELYRRFFHDLEMKDWIRGFVQDLLEGKMDKDLVYKRKLTKPQNEYIKNIPPHVRALRLIDPDGKKGLRRISYIISDQGPVPVGHPGARPDYRHYLEKQIKPVADSILQFLDSDLDSLLEGRQLELF